jgi:hypothetical protein
MRCRRVGVGLAQPTPLNTAWHLNDNAPRLPSNKFGAALADVSGGFPQHVAARGPAAHARSQEPPAAAVQVFYAAPETDELIQQAQQYITSRTRNA